MSVKISIFVFCCKDGRMWRENFEKISTIPEIF